MTFDEARERLIALGQENGGVLIAAVVEGDPELAATPTLASAAGRALDGSTNVFGTPRAAFDDGWFPFERLEFH